MARLVKSVAQRTNNFEDIDKQLAYMVWLAEKEFTVGAITEDYLAMKFFNLFDKNNTETYKNSGTSTTTPDGRAKTIGE